MTSSVVMNPNQFNNGLDQYMKRFERRWRVRMKMLVDQGMVRMLRRTPVHTGQAAMSYVASVGAPKGGSAGAGFPVNAPTNQLPLGAEENRGRAENVSRATLASVNYNDPFQVFWIVNNAPSIGGLEAGELPEEPYTPRSPQGMFGVTLQELSALLDTTPL
jgi:hypothetical protein